MKDLQTAIFLVLYFVADSQRKEPDNICTFPDYMLENSTTYIANK
jgi:hypothetical protein